MSTVKEAWDWVVRAGAPLTELQWEDRMAPAARNAMLAAHKLGCPACKAFTACGYADEIERLGAS